MMEEMTKLTMAKMELSTHTFSINVFIILFFWDSIYFTVELSQLFTQKKGSLNEVFFRGNTVIDFLWKYSHVNILSNHLPLK